MLNDSGIESKLAVAVDNNDIDKLVTEYNPTHVIIEALWVVPEKFTILQQLHPNVKWIVRLHSNIPFIANEGMAMGWIGKYMEYKNLQIACNSLEMFDEIKLYAQEKTGKTDSVIYLPNFYPQEYKTKIYDKNKDTIDIGCFGAIRPLKNNLIQALAAIRFAESINKKLRFHVNADRTEMKGEPVARNLFELFEQFSNKGHVLINEGWVDRENFIKICSKIDIGMQVSFSETFNIVGADLISQGVPVIGSSEIPWLSCLYEADPCKSGSIFRKLEITNAFPKFNVYFNQIKLTAYTNKSRKIWLKYINSNL
jgi:hypothetical protein